MKIAYFTYLVGGFFLAGRAHTVNAQPSANQNYVVTNSIQQAGITNATAVQNLGPAQRQQQITYFDGLGRPVQQITRQGSPQQHDLVVPVEYDAMGRPSVTYLPYAASNGDGSLKPNALTQQNNFYNTVGDRIANDGSPSSEAIYEASPLGRVLQQGEAGAAWQPTAGHAHQFSQRTNLAGEVRLFTYANGTISSVGLEFQPGIFSVRETIDEHGAKTAEFTDMLGRLILKKVQKSDAPPISDADYLLTYNVYDDFGHLRLIIPPAGVQEVPTTGSWTASSAFIKKWCFAYTYDEQQRIASKQVPGAGKTWYIYNKRNKVVLTEDANGNRLFTKYDALNRPIMTGNYYSSLTFAQLQNTASNTAIQYESVVSGTGANLLTYSLTNSFPTDITEYDLLTRIFYDSYAYDALGNRAFTPITLAAATISNDPGQADFTVSSADQSTQVNGLVTIKQEQDSYYGGGTWLTTVFYYDNKGRIIQTLADHYRGGQERMTLKLSFAGQTLQSYLQHSYPTNAHPTSPYEQHTIYQENIFDTNSRLVQTSMKVDAQEKIIVSSMEYNEVGQLVDKKLHSDDRGDSFVQSVDYRYNIRGWLININNRNLNNNEWLDSTDPNSDNLTSAWWNGDAYNSQRSATVQPDLFGLELKYDDRHSIGLPTTQHEAQYNGNIATAIWKTRNNATGNGLRAYAYHYDKVNRITDARYRTYEYNPAANAYQMGVFGTDYSTTGVAYDANGNITDMNRQGDGAIAGVPAPLDQLHYTYSTTDGNQLQTVDDAVVNSAPTHDFEDNGYKNGVEYRYDANGNLLQDSNKGIANIYYSPANLPVNIYLQNYRAILFDYSGGGTKLRKITYEWNGSTYIFHYTEYVGGFIYEDGVLVSAPTPEGRILYTDNSANRPNLDWKYEYHMRDHLGNLRFAFRTDGNSAQQRTAGLEPINAQQEEEQFDNISNTRQLDAQQARTGNYVAYLNANQGRRVGPSIMHTVAAGDSVYAEVYGRYDHGSTAGSFIRKGAIVSGAIIANDPLKHFPEQILPPARKRRAPFLGASISIIPQLLKSKRDVFPSAFLKCELFSKDSQLVASHIQPLQRSTADTWQQLKTGLRADSAGYVKVSVINESGNPAYFDDMLLRPIDAVKVQENHYDPWGLNLVGIESIGNPNSKLQFNGKEKQEDFGLNWTDYGARMYDMQLGRWHTVDRYAEKYYSLSPYNYGGNNPIGFIDINGDSLVFHSDGTGRNKALAAADGIINDGLGGFYTASRNKRGSLTLKSTGKEGKMSDSQQAFYNEINGIIKEKDDVKVAVFLDDSDTFMGNFGSGTIDPSDMLKFANSEVATPQSIMAHELREQKAKQLGGADYKAAHAIGIGAENRVSGYVRENTILNNTFNETGPVYGSGDIPYSKGKSTYILRLSAEDGAVKSMKTIKTSKK